MTQDLEDSEDLTDQEVADAIFTQDAEDLKSQLQAVSIQGYALRRRKPHLYCRVKVAVDKFLVFQIDWVDRGGPNVGMWM